MFRRGANTGRFVARAVTILSLVLMIGAAVWPNLAGAESPYSTISPTSPEANDINDLYRIIFFLALVVFVGVQILIVYTALRYRRRSENDPRPPQSHGNKTLEIVWTIIPAIILLLIFIPTVRTIYARADNADEAKADMVVEVYGKQWWWEIHYTQPNEVAGVITGNEVHVPAGKQVLFKFYSNNVIHSFWVPQLSGKMDVIPGHVNAFAINTDTPGYYYGECAEFCGDSHALMRFKVIVQPQEEFDAWVAAWKAGPTDAVAQYAADGDISKAPASFGLCLGCHRVNGTNASVAPVGLEEDPGTLDAPGAARVAGPNLTLFGCRTTIAAGTLINTPENLAAWLHDPGSIKPGNYMASVITPGLLTEEQITELVGYLEGLQPDGGCTAIPEQPEGNIPLQDPGN